MDWPGWIYFAGLLAVVLGAFWRTRKWLKGKRQSPVRMGDLAKIPVRYFHDVHEVVYREAPVAHMHVAAAGGFVLLNLMIFVVHVVGLRWSAAVWALLIAAAIQIFGSMLAFRRRSDPKRSARLSQGAYKFMPFALFAFGTFYFFTSLQFVDLIKPLDWHSVFSIPLLFLGIFGVFFLIPGMVLGPMRHAFAGALHLAFHPRPERFQDHNTIPSTSPTALKDVDLSGDELGVNKPQDFSWRQLLSYDACIQCGRCEVVCPAFAAGAPLNPKNLIFDLCSAGLGDGTGENYAGHPHPGLEDRKAVISTDGAIVGEDSILLAETVWSCTTCRACVEECPMLIEHVDAIIDLRRFETLEKGEVPEGAIDALESLSMTDTICGKSTRQRLDWAADIDLPNAKAGEEFDVLLWLGEGAFDLRGQRILRSLVRVLRAANIDFRVLGEHELDVGDLARRLGDEALYQSLTVRVIQTLEAYKFSKIVTNDPHVLNALKNEYPGLGASFRVQHHTSFVADLVKSGCLSVSPLERSQVTFHDPCYLGRYNREFEAPRNLLKAVGLDLVEMELSASRSFCCGWGGGAAFTDIPSRHRIPDLRMDQAKATGASLVVTACPNCANMFDGVSGTNIEVQDVIELVAAALCEKTVVEASNDEA